MNFKSFFNLNISINYWENWEKWEEYENFENNEIKWRMQKDELEYWSEKIVNNILSDEGISYDISDNREYPYYISPNFQGVDLFNATNFAAKYKEKEIRVDEKGVSLIKQSNDLDFRDVTLSYENKDLKIVSVTRNKSTFDLYNEIIVYGNGLKSIKRNRKSIDKFGKKTLEEVNMELVSQDDVDSRAKGLLKAHSEGDDRFTVRMSITGI